MVNQKCDTNAATTDTKKKISRIVRPRDTRATKIAINGP